MRNSRFVLACATVAGVFMFGGLAPAVSSAAQASQAPGQVSHVLLISVDGLHSVDLANYVRTHPSSAMAELSRSGVTYTNASTSQPSDSFPGLLSIVTGGSPRQTGVYYDSAYDRSLSAPGSDCSAKGVNTVYNETVDANMDVIDGGGSIDPKNLPRDPAHGCQPVYPHSYLRVNTVFEVVKAAGMRTAWSDKNLAYEIVNGPSGKGVDDLYNPEILATHNTDGSWLYADHGPGNSIVTDTMPYDNFKVNAIINEIDGKDHTGTQTVGVPAIFGMNFQSVSVGQKSPHGGYVADAAAVGGFSPTGDAVTGLNYVDGALGRMLAELKSQGLLGSTLFVLTAKHGQDPIDPSILRKIGHAVPDTLKAQGIQAALVTDDDVALVWLSQTSQTQGAVNALTAQASSIGVSNPGQILSGGAILAQFGDPASDPRVPDVIVTPDKGVIYTKAAKIEEHGGFSHDDINVALLVSNPGLSQTTVSDAVQTTQVAPTILQALGLRPNDLQAVAATGIGTLPMLPQLAAPGHSGSPGMPRTGSEGESSMTAWMVLVAMLVIMAGLLALKFGRKNAR